MSARVRNNSQSIAHRRHLAALSVLVHRVLDVPRCLPSQILVLLSLAEVGCMHVTPVSHADKPHSDQALVKEDHFQVIDCLLRLTAVCIHGNDHFRQSASALKLAGESESGNY